MNSHLGFESSFLRVWVSRLVLGYPSLRWEPGGERWWWGRLAECG